MTDQPTPPTPFPPAEAIEAAWSAYQNTTQDASEPYGTLYDRAMRAAILAALPLMGIAGLMRETVAGMEADIVEDDDFMHMTARLRAMADRIEGKTT